MDDIHRSFDPGAVRHALERQHRRGTTRDELPAPRSRWSPWDLASGND